MIIKILIFIFAISIFTQLHAVNLKPINGKNFYRNYNLGKEYKHAQSRDRNLYKAFNLLHKLALKGDVLSQYKLGLMFHYGQGVRQNAELARLWFTRAAKRGHSKAQDILYRFYSAKKPQYFNTTKLRFSKNFRRYR